MLERVDWNIMIDWSYTIMYNMIMSIKQNNILLIREELALILVAIREVIRRKKDPPGEDQAWKIQLWEIKDVIRAEYMTEKVIGLRLKEMGMQTLRGRFVKFVPIPQDLKLEERLVWKSGKGRTVRGSVQRWVMDEADELLASVKKEVVAEQKVPGWVDQRKKEREDRELEKIEAQRRDAEAMQRVRDQLAAENVEYQKKRAAMPKPEVREEPQVVVPAGPDIILDAPEKVMIPDDAGEEEE